MRKVVSASVPRFAIQSGSPLNAKATVLLVHLEAGCDALRTDRLIMSDSVVTNCYGIAGLHYKT